jgi:fermentation-respiration switch protein FrsA (DUF1100 family)
MDVYLSRIEEAARALVSKRLLLADDVAFVKRAAQTHWQVVTGPAAPAASPQSSTAFSAVPCPVQPWEYTDPSFQALLGARAFSGRYAGGLYQLEVPDRWNGELVLYAHGAVRNEGPRGSTLRVQTPALREHWIRNGFAWAASSYRCNGSIYGVAMLDTRALIDVFRERNPGRAPSRTYLAGQSLGGRAVILGLREYPAEFAGALAMCPAGQETNDLRAAFAAAAEAITGVRLQRGTLNEDIARMSAIVGAAPSYSDKGRQLANLEIQLSGGPRPFAAEGLATRLTANLRDGVAMTPDHVVRAATTEGIPLPEAARAKSPEAGLRTTSTSYREVLPFDGRLERPLLTIQGTGDLQVPVYQQQALKRAVMAAGTDHLLVQRLMRIPGHCQFSDAEQAAAFDALVAWVRDGTRPEGDDVLGDLSDAGRRFTNPLRPGDPGTINVGVTP